MYQNSIMFDSLRLMAKMFNRAMASFRSIREEGEERSPSPDNNASQDADTDFSCPSSEEETRDDLEEPEGSHEPGLPTEKLPPSLVLLMTAWKDKYTQNLDEDKPVTRVMFSEWVKHLSMTPTITCPKENCTKTFTTAYGLKYHYPRCGPVKGYQCLRCGVSGFAHSWSMLAHLRECYPERPEGDTGSVQRSRRSRNTIILDSDDSPLVLKLCRRMAKFQQEKQSWNRTLFPSWRPRDWCLLDDREADAYLPRFKESPQLRLQKLGQQERGPWQRLSLFEVLPKEEGQCHTTFFPGGAIWAGAWCPTPPCSMIEDAPAMHQWVALACCLDPDKGHLLTDACPERGLLQVWALGALNLRSAGCDPKLALALGHDFGFVADLCWCPSGCWEDRLPDHATGARRLGLLALACGDGSVRILSIPVPEDLDCPEGRRPLFGGGGCWATLKLFPGQLGISPCLRVAWEPSNEHRLLAAAYADGRAAVFDLAGKGPLAHGLGEPLWVVQAHSAAVTGLAWAAGTLARHLCTASIDQEAKVWPFERPGTVPTSCFRRGPVRSLAVSPHWNGMFLTGEESFM